MTCRMQISSLFAALVLCLACFLPVQAADDEIPNSGTVDSYGVFGFDYQLENVKLTKREWYSDGQLNVKGEAIAPTVNISGKLNLVLSAYMLNEFKAKIKASTNKVDANGTGFTSLDYACDGPTWEWNEILDGREVKKGYRKQVPFSLDVSVPAYNAKAGVKYVYFEIRLDIWQTIYAYEQPERKHNYVTLNGELKIPEGRKPEPKKMDLSIKSGDEFEPLKITLTLRDPAGIPVEGAVIKVRAPLRGSEVLTVPDSAGKSSWTLAGYFRTAAKCLNCGQGQPVSKFATEYYYCLKDPGQVIEVVTNEQGQAELEFYLDLAALGGERAPKRIQPLSIPIRAVHEYMDTDSEPPTRLLARADLVIQMKYIGYVVAITCVKPQEFKYINHLVGHQPLPHDATELPLNEYRNDPGTPKPHETVYGADRVKLTPYIVALSETDQSEIQRDALPSRTLKKGMLFSYGDEIMIDARGMVRKDPDTEAHGQVGQPGEPGWIWVKVRFFDSTSAKVGVNGLYAGYFDDRHTLTFGYSPEESGWKPTSIDDFIYWAGKKAAEQVVKKFNPALGHLTTVINTGKFLKWTVTEKPIYIRVESELHVSSREDGSTTITVREGRPVLISEETGSGGIAAEVGSTIVLGSDDGIQVRPSSPEEINRAEELLSDVRNFDTSGLEVIEVEDMPPPAAPPAVTTTPVPPLTEGAPPEETPPAEEPNKPSTVLPDTRTMMSIRVYDLGFELKGEWELWPESEEDFPVVANPEIGLFVAVLNLPVKAPELIQELGYVTGAVSSLTVAGRPAQWIPLLDPEGEFGALLCFDEPLPDGSYMYLNFFAGIDYWNRLYPEVADVLEGLRFL